jgi:predicted house-cleaning noncanonical NTP pyrophosphatase (MazG superfamily)
MPLKSVGSFQRKIYEVLIEDAKLKQETIGVYLSVQQDAKYPFILINLLKLDDLSKYNKFSYEIEFEICLFSKDKNQEKLLYILDHITNVIQPSMIGIANYHVVAIKFSKAEWVRGQDNLTIKIITKYKALIMGDRYL